MIKWLLRLVILLLILLVGSYFFRVEFGDGKVTISPRSASDRAKFWPAWTDEKSAPQKQPSGGKTQAGKPTPDAAPKKANAPVPVKPKDKISEKDKKALESILEQEL